jgi:cytochrome P450
MNPPNLFDIFRQAKVPISWGHGVHVCLGMHLARLEMPTAINLLLDRLPNLRLDPEGDDPHIRGMVFRSPTSLPGRQRFETLQLRRGAYDRLRHS